MKAYTKAECLAGCSEAKDSFQENGFIHIKGVFSPSLCTEAIRAIQSLEETLEHSNEIDLVTESIHGETLVKYYQGIYTQDKAFRKFFNLDLLSIAAFLLGEKDLYFADLEAHIRNPGGGAIPRHQDNFYFNLKRALGLTAYIALTQHDKESGGLNYKSKSHQRVVDHELSEVAGFSSTVPKKVFDSIVAADQIYSPTYDSGDISIHHPNNIHWSDECPDGCMRGYALSARVFGIDDEIDEKGLERYQRLLSKNRS